MGHFLFFTTPEWAAFILRLILGAVMLPHGMQKVFGSFGGYGYRATMNYFTDTMSLPWLIAFAVIIIEFVGATVLIAGFASRVWACGLAAIMIGAIVTTNFRNGFFMNWFELRAGKAMSITFSYSPSVSRSSSSAAVVSQSIRSSLQNDQKLSLTERRKLRIEGARPRVSLRSGKTRCVYFHRRGAKAQSSAEVNANPFLSLSPFVLRAKAGEGI